VTREPAVAESFTRAEIRNKSLLQGRSRPGDESRSGARRTQACALPVLTRIARGESNNFPDSFRWQTLPSGFVCCLLFRLLAASSAAQKTPAPAWRVAPSQDDKSQNNYEADESKSNNKAIEKQEKTGTSNDRLFFTLPNFLTLETMNVPPLTAGRN